MKCKQLTNLATFFMLITALLTVSDNAFASDELRFNPFRQPDVALEKISSGNELKLRGTVIDGKDSMVNIGGEFYRLNQEVSGYRVVRIERGKVTLQRGVNEMVLTLNEGGKF